MIFEFLYGKIFLILAFIYLLYTDIKFKKVSRNYCILIICISLFLNAINVINGYIKVENIVKELLFILIFTGFLGVLSYFSGEKIGYGDVLVYLFFSLNVGFNKSIFVFLLSLLISSMYIFVLLIMNILGGGSFKDKEIAFVPFNFLSILCIMLFDIYL